MAKSVEQLVQELAKALVKERIAFYREVAKDNGEEFTSDDIMEIDQSAVLEDCGLEEAIVAEIISASNS